MNYRPNDVAEERSPFQQCGVGHANVQIVFLQVLLECFRTKNLDYPEELILVISTTEEVLSSEHLPATAKCQCGAAIVCLMDA